MSLRLFCTPHKQAREGIEIVTGDRLTEQHPVIARYKNNKSEGKKKRKSLRGRDVAHERASPSGIGASDGESRSNLSDVGARSPRLPGATDRLIKRQPSPTGSELGEGRTAHSERPTEKHYRRGSVWRRWDRSRNFAPPRAGICSFDLSFAATRGPFVNRRFERRVVAQSFYVAR